MVRGSVELQGSERFTDGFRIPKDKLENVLCGVTKKLKEKAPVYMEQFPLNEKEHGRYQLTSNCNWVHGMHTGTYLLCYEITGDKAFLDVAKHHLDSYQERLDKNINMDDHDAGFVFSPSCVAYYKVTGDKHAKELALRAADVLYSRCYTEKGGFIMRGSRGMHSGDADMCRTMVDSMFNVPLFLWKGQITGDEKFTKAALSQCKVTEACLVREDGSSYHHYQFELDTHKPLHGLTFQGNRDESTWSRGHSWLVAGYPIAWNYAPQDYMLPLHRDVTYYFLNHLPEDLISYWDLDFISGEEPRDTSAAAIVVCGMLEAARVMPYSANEKEILVTAAHKIMNNIIDKYTTETGEEYDGLLTGVTAARKFPGYAIEGCGLYGDYFFLEALVRMTKPEWARFW